MPDTATDTTWANVKPELQSASEEQNLKMPLEQTSPDGVVQYGLTELYSDSDPTVDIVFVHGFNGHPYYTWAHRPVLTFWPSKLLPIYTQDESVRILTYGYDATVSAFTDGTGTDIVHQHSGHLVTRLVANEG